MDRPFNLDDELRSLAQEMLGAGWKTKPEAEWTPDEHRAYHQWAKRERARLREEAAARGETIRVEFELQTYPYAERERRKREDVGEFLRPEHFTLRFDDNRVTQYSENGETVSKQYIGIDLEEV